MATYCYRFSLGNSDTNALGLCFDVILEQNRRNKKAALKKAKELFSEWEQEPLVFQVKPLEHFCLYLNQHHFREEDIVDIREIQSNGHG